MSEREKCALLSFLNQFVLQENPLKTNEWVVRDLISFKIAINPLIGFIANLNENIVQGLE